MHGLLSLSPSLSASQSPFSIISHSDVSPSPIRSSLDSPLSILLSVFSQYLLLYLTMCIFISYSHLV